MRRQRFRFETIDETFILKSDIAMIFIQFVISIIYLGSWVTFIMVRIPRVVWGCIMNHGKKKIIKSKSA